MANRWGKQIFALPARGFDTLEFHDEKSAQAPDMGLLSWLTGSVSPYFSCCRSLRTDRAVIANHHLASAHTAIHLFILQVPPHFIPHPARVVSRVQARYPRLVGRLRHARHAQ